ncbi:MAG TPA: TraR/DksA family transcriptional regulator [Bacteroidales bacterium]|nr:TraR/DksA family transcriptional regulator [Bacteroidales bacterium]
MSPEEKNQIGVLIEAKLVKLEAQIADLKELTRPIEPDCAIGTVSRMDAINNKSVNESTLRKKIVQQNALQHALTILYTDEFDRCVVCGHPIPSARLLLMPDSRKCVRCASLKI